MLTQTVLSGLRQSVFRVDLPIGAPLFEAAKHLLVKTQWVLLVTVLMLPLTLSSAFAQQLETIAACDEGVIGEPILLNYDDSTSNCRINLATESDTFVFDGEAGDVVRLSILSRAGGLDPVMEVIPPVGATLTTLSCNGGTGGICADSEDVTLPVTGTYFMILSDQGINETGLYLLQLTKLNDNSATQAVIYDDTFGDTISPQTDVDFFTFFARADTSIRFNLLSTSPGYDPRVELSDSLGNLVPGTICDGGTGGICSFSTDIDMPQDGYYSVRVSDNGINEVGSFIAGIWCTQGPCDSDGNGIPDPSPPLVNFDEPFQTALASRVDADYFSFNASAGTVLRFNLLSRTAGFDPRVEIRNELGELVLTDACDGGTGGICAFTEEFVPTSSGIYTAFVSDSGVNEAGTYLAALWCVNGPCDSDADGLPDADHPDIYFAREATAEVATQVSPVFFTFNGTADTLLELNFLSRSPGFDPRIELYSPDGELLDSQFCDGGTGGICSKRFQIAPLASGEYQLLVSDQGINEVGNVEISIRCLHGDCDSDADGVLDGGHEVLFYGETISDNLDARTDVNFYTLRETDTRSWRLNVLSQSPGFDPIITARDADGEVVFTGTDGAFCDGGTGGICSFILNVTPDQNRQLSLAISDSGINEFGSYQMTLDCIGVGCENPAPNLDADNCVEVGNGPEIPDAMGNSQVDTDGDGIGNGCDADLDNDCVVNFQDLALFSSVFLSDDPDADFNGDGSVNFLDFTTMVAAFLGQPGPSGIPNLCGQN